MWVQIPPGGMDVSLLWALCVSGRGPCGELLTRPEESNRLWCVVVFDLETSGMRRPWPTGGCCAKRNKHKSFLLTWQSRNSTALTKRSFLYQITPTECTVLITAILKKHLQHVSVHVYHLQGEKKASFKKLLPLKRCYAVLLSVAALLLTLINYKRHSSTDF